jgi:tetratricopeptide (TPR) repeat protein
MNDVSLGMKTVDDLQKQGEIYGSFERLQETYFLGEYEPVVMTFDPVKKREMLDLWRDLRELQRIGDERDLANVEGYVNKVKGRAKDFPGTSILSKVNNAINASNMSILSAKQAALSGDTNKAEAALERAGKIWPQNPQIKEFANQVVSRQDKIGQMVPEFDRLVSESKWRDIFNKKLEFALALSSDKARSEKLRQIVNRVGELDANIQKASVLASQNNPYLAWDVLVEANKTESDDLVLAKTRSDIAPLVSDYARLIGLAEKFEKEGAEAAALNAWLQAQDINPASLACGEAIKRLARIVAGGSNVRATSEVPVPPLTPATTDEVPVPPAR